MSEIRLRIEGRPPGLLMHNIDGGFIESKERAEVRSLTSMSAKAKKEPANVLRLQELEWRLGLYLREGRPTLPAKVIRAAIVGAARLTKDGKRVERGAVVTDVDFSFDGDDLSLDEMWAEDDSRFVHQAAVRVGQQRVLRVRPVFPAWSAAFTVEYADDFVNERDLMNWLRVAGSSIGVGDWRPDKGGEYGRFDVA